MKRTNLIHHPKSIHNHPLPSTVMHEGSMFVVAILLFPPTVAMHAIFWKHTEIFFCIPFDRQIDLEVAFLFDVPAMMAMGGARAPRQVQIRASN